MPGEKSFGVGIVVFAFLFGVSVGVASTLGYFMTRNTAATSAATATGSGIGNRAGMPATASPQARNEAPGVTGVFINQGEITQQQLAELKQLYGMSPPPGRYWYDSRSGLYGKWGFEAAGYIRPGHKLGTLPADASRGNTGVFINGREINMTEAMFFQNIFGAVYRGRWWLDGQTGNVGLEGNTTPMANVVAALQQAQGRGQGGGGGGYRWRDSINGFSGGAESGCVWVNIPGGSYTGSGC